MAIPFSIIIPVYNKEAYILNCINSIISQSFDNFEVIIVNDGSTDGCLQILNNITDNRFKVISTKNNGVSIARNIGINHSKGQYLVFIDADDYISSKYLETIYKVLQNGEIDILIWGLTKVHTDGSQTVLIPFRNGPINFECFLQTYMSEFERLDGIYGYVCNKAIKRTFINKHGITFNPQIKQAEDLDFWLSVYSCKPEISFLQYADYYYVQNTDNSSFFFKCKPWPLIKIWVKTLKLLQNSNTVNEVLIKDKIWKLFEVVFWECENITIHTIKQELRRIAELRNNYPSLNLYNTRNFLSRQIKNKRTFNIYLYLQLRHLYHVVRLWLK